MRIYLTGRMAIEGPSGLVDEADLPGRQGRLAFAFLALAAQRPVARDSLADAVWGDRLPSRWDAALKSLVSKLRVALGRSGLARGDAISAVSGCYQLRLPSDAWIDIEVCTRSIDFAEAALRRCGDWATAWSEATVATAIARRPFLAGEDLPWIDELRAQLRSWHVRAVDCLTDVWLAEGNAPLATSLAQEALRLEPYRESGYRRLMRAHALGGDRADALRAYDRCAELLADELGVQPDAETTALREAITAGAVDSPRTTPDDPRSSGRHSDDVASDATPTVTIVVTDIVGSTSLAERLGDSAWHRVLGSHDAIVRSCTDDAGGRLVKHLGDGFLITFPSSTAALRATAAMQDGMQQVTVGGEPVVIRVGVHAGEPIYEDHDVFGLQVNVAARIASLACGGEVLASALVHDLTRPGEFAFSEPRIVQLAGVTGDHLVYRVDSAD